MKKIVELLKDLVDEEILEKILNDYTNIKDTNIAELGVDSLNVMQIVIRMEDLYGIDIDYDSFEIDQISTPNKIKLFLDNCQK